MSILKPVPIVPQTVSKLCPFCGKASYSRDGIHPQCAISQADAPRNERLRESRKLEPKIDKPRSRLFSKSCPVCGNYVHVRMPDCACGHAFAAAAN